MFASAHLTAVKNASPPLKLTKLIGTHPLANDESAPNFLYTLITQTIFVHTILLQPFLLHELIDF